MRAWHRVPEVVLLVTICACIFSIINALISWDEYSARSALLVVYLILPFVIGLVLTAALVNGRAAVLNSLLVLISCGFSLLITEWFAKFTVDNPNFIAAARAGVIYDTRSKDEVVESLRAEGEKAYPTTDPSLVLALRREGERTKYITFGSISQSKLVQCNESGEYVTFESDAHGFRNPGNIFGKEISIVLVGDSFAQGHCVPVGSGIAERMRESLDGVLTLGHGGNGPLLELGSLREYASEIKPPELLWLYYEGNDLHNLREEKQDSLLLKYLKPDFSQGLIGRQDEVDAELKQIVRSAYQSANSIYARRKSLLLFLKLYHLRELLGLTAYPRREPPPDLNLLEAIFVRAKTEVESWGGRLRVVYLPHWKRYYYPEQAAPTRADVLEILGELNIEVIDLHKAFSRVEDTEALFTYPGRNNHYSVRGYQLAAEVIVEALNGSTSPVYK